jgi:Fe-S cluster assembly protein SufD
MTLAAAIRTGDVTLLPSRRDEDWRWTDISGLLRVLPPPSSEEAPALAPGPFGDVGDDEVAVINGVVEEGAASLTVQAGQTCERRLRFISTCSETRHEARLTINLGPGARLLLLESYEGEGVHGYVDAATLDVHLAEGAVLERIVIAGRGEGAVEVSTAVVDLHARARFSQTVLTEGAKRRRIETRVAHLDEGAQARLDGVYLLSGASHADITTVVTHKVPGGTTDQLVKGVVRDQGRAVFQGRIVVARGADRTVARMGHHALILSDRAEVDAKPELEIYADDVACGHGNTVGNLDEDALFYARQRGMPEAVARAMLTEAFVGEVIERIEHEGAREAARVWAAQRLGG